ncbi:HEPN domain-containing protein [uncultured Dysgonomonas sp.]|uniref:HEPN domain-containing protein n=1 Tax=uncultured Dysgonomonas sp. TaxID=206096 RepID=UPI0026374600|nr:HEPN domain-containing protein [uncultured Dysgonomonas sp.]
MELDKEKLKSILESCLQDGLELIQKQKEEDKKRDWNFTFEYHAKYPSMSSLGNRMPSFYLNNYQKIDYSKYLTKDKKHLDINSWRNYHDFVQNSEPLRHYFGLMEYGNFTEDAKEESKRLYNQIYTYYFLSDFVDSFIHTASLEFDSKIFDELFDLYYNSIIKEKLEITIAVPIIFADFDFDEFLINDSISIRRISNEIQLARNIRKNYTTSAHETVIGAATHAFYLNGWFADNNRQNQLENSLTDLGSFGKPLVIIEKLFAALRLACNIEVGYCQVVSIPVNWQYRKNVDLPLVFVASEKKYPDKFENYGWLEPLMKLSSESLNSYTFIYEKLTSEQYSLAIKRLNSATLRKNDEDSIIDITIALESLLTNDSSSEITYRLATRASQICKLSKFEDYSTKQVFDLCKKIYNYRSAVVHGDIKRIEKTKKIVSNESKEIEIIKVSIDLLKHVLLTILQKEIKDTNAIDEIMM